MPSALPSSLRQRWKVGVATNRFLAEVLASAEPDDGNGKREQCAKEGAERSVRSPLAGHQRPPLTRSRRANASNWIEVPALAARAKDRDWHMDKDRRGIAIGIALGIALPTALCLLLLALSFLTIPGY
jgi:hypothetical protein